VRDVENPDLAIELAEEAARRDGLQVAPYRHLFGLHTKLREWDAAWCAAAVLVLLGDATDDERAHYERFAPREATPVAAALDQLQLQSLLVYEDDRERAFASGSDEIRLDRWANDHDRVTLAHERGWAERVLGLRTERFFRGEPPTLDAEVLYVAAKAVIYERPPEAPQSPDAIDRSANRVALVLSGSFAAFEKVNPRAAGDALFPFAASRLHAGLRRHLGRNIDARRARTVEEMRFYTSLHPCKTCGGPPRDLVVEQGPDFYTLSGPCVFCGTRANFAFFVDGEPAKVTPPPHELGPDKRPSQIVLRAMLADELSRCLAQIVPKPFEIGPAAWHTSVRAIGRVITCAAEIAKGVPGSDQMRNHQRDTCERFLALARDYAAAWPRIAELEGKRLSLREEIAGLLAQIMRDRLPAAADLRAYFAARKVRSIQGDREIVVVIGPGDVTAVRIWDDASGTHALLAVAKGTKEDVGELERVVEGHRVHLSVATLESGALTRVSLHFALKQVATAPIAPMLAKLFDASGPPQTVTALEEALGIALDGSIFPAAGMGVFSVPRVGAGASVTSLSAKYYWDIFHEQPIHSLEELRGRPVYEWTAGFGDAISQVEAALRECFGAPREAEKGLVFGSFVVSRGAPFTLSWYSALPDWALPQPDASVRRSALLAIARVLETTGDHAAMTKAAATVLADSGITSESSYSCTTFHFSPNMPAGDLARILGWRDAVGETFSVHRDRWEIRVVVGTSEYGPVTEVPRVGVWSVKAHLTAGPTGGKWGKPEDAPGPLDPAPSGFTLPRRDAYLVGPDDLVRSLEITLR
jgi:hypothetical protein